MIQLNKYEKILLRSILVFLLFWYGAYWQYIPILIFHLDVHNISSSMQVILSTFSGFILLFIFLAIYRKDLKEDFQTFRKNLAENMDVGFRYWVAGLAIMIVSNLIINLVFKAGGAGNEKVVQEMIRSLPFIMFLDTGFIAPITEEIAFRKTLKDVLGKYKWVFVAASFLLFGGAHVIGQTSSWVDYLYIIPYGSLGAALALTYYKTDTIFTSISMHMIHNIILTLLTIITL